MNKIEKFCLRWNEFQANLCGTFSKLRMDNNFADVTLVCQEGKQIKAHRVILAASSPLLASILMNFQEPNPMIFLRGVSTKNLKSMVDFMYQGDVDINQDDLNDFLAMTGDLQLKGLSQENPASKETEEPQENDMDTTKSEKEIKVEIKNERQLYSDEEDGEVKSFKTDIEEDKKVTPFDPLCIAKKSLKSHKKQRKDVARKRIMNWSTKAKFDSYLCPDCGKDFSGRAIRRRFPRHIRKCKIEQFSCDCPGVPNMKPGKISISNDFKIKEKHILVVHQGLYDCRTGTGCHFTSETPEDLQKHVKDKHTSEEIQTHEYGNFQCSECGQKFDSVLSSGTGVQAKLEYEKHMRIHDVIKFECECGDVPSVRPGQEFGPKGFNLNKEFRLKERHMRVQHEGWFGCNSCFKNFENPENLVKHEKSHKENNICDMCGFTGKCMKYHKKRAHEINLTKCSLCDMVLQNPPQLKNHMKKEHKARIECKICGGKFKKIEYHLKTMHTLNEDKKYPCNTCEKRFTEKQRLEDHINNVHTKSNKYQCRFGCENSYTDRSNRSAHENRRHGQTIKTNVKI